MKRKQWYCALHTVPDYPEPVKYSERAKQEMSNDVYEQWPQTLKAYACLEGCHVEGDEVIIEPCPVSGCSYKGGRLTCPPYYVFKDVPGNKPGRAVKHKPKKRKKK